MHYFSPRGEGWWDSIGDIHSCHGTRTLLSLHYLPYYPTLPQHTPTSRHTAFFLWACLSSTVLCHTHPPHHHNCTTRTTHTPATCLHTAACTGSPASSRRCYHFAFLFLYSTPPATSSPPHLPRSALTPWFSRIPTRGFSVYPLAAGRLSRRTLLYATPSAVRALRLSWLRSFIAYTTSAAHHSARCVMHALEHNVPTLIVAGERVSHRVLHTSRTSPSRRNTRAFVLRLCRTTVQPLWVSDDISLTSTFWTTPFCCCLAIFRFTARCTFPCCCCVPASLLTHPLAPLHSHAALRTLAWQTLLLLPAPHCTSLPRLPGARLLMHS